MNLVGQRAAGRNARRNGPSELVLARAHLRAHVGAPPHYMPARPHSVGGRLSEHAQYRACLRSLEQKVRRLLHVAAGLAERIGDRRRRHGREKLCELCECLSTQVTQSFATERAKPHSSALADSEKRHVPSLVGNGPYRLVLRRRRHLRRRGVRRDWQRLRRGLRTQHAARG